jgi:hypothetical protein
MVSKVHNIRSRETILAATKRLWPYETIAGRSPNDCEVLHNSWPVCARVLYFTGNKVTKVVVCPRYT